MKKKVTLNIFKHNKKCPNRWTFDEHLKEKIENMQVEHKTEKGTVLFVKVPEGASDSTYPKVGMIDLYFQTKFQSEDEEDNYISIGLPTLGFKLIGLTSDVTEAQAKMMVPLIVRVYGQSYYDYAVKFNVGYGYVGTALESFKSMMKVNDIHECNPFGTKQPVIQNDYTSYELRSGWNEKQSRTGKWIVLFKPN